MHYKETLHLPVASQSLKLQGAESEHQLLAHWNDVDLYRLRQNMQSNSPSLHFHDGPPYAQKNVQLGQAFNKILKDVLVRSLNMMGTQCDFVPGWDCHGLPIALQVEKLLKEQHTTLSTLDFRKACRSYVEEAITEQTSLFQRLGVLADWSSPYSTMSPSYEAEITRAIAKLIRNGSFTRKNSPVHWCGSCSTALAEFEVDYRNISSPSLYISYPLISDPIHIDRTLRGRNIECIVWTTAPWYLPGSVGIAVHPEAEYVVVRVHRKLYLLAKDCLAQVGRACGWRGNEDIVVTCLGKDLDSLECRHPFIHRKAPIHADAFVSSHIGSGCVHLAPGHSRDDYRLGQRVGLDVLCPIDARGRFLPEVERWGGQHVFDTTQRIIRLLRDWGALVNKNKQEVEHRYPHCRRCKAPTIGRATPQWFLSAEKSETREHALQAIEEVQWQSAHVKHQMRQQLEKGHDWCLSRQRKWGVPVPVFYCTRCRRPLLDADFVETLADQFEKHPRGAEFWYESSTEDLLQLFENKPRCPRCFLESYRKEEDIIDVWFEAGISFKAGFSPHIETPPVIDVYFEAEEQLRGWFPSALLTSIVLYEQAPFRTVWTHGSGPLWKKASNEELEPSVDRLIEQYGAELLRTCAVSGNIEHARSLSHAHLEHWARHLKKIRSICQFLLANVTRAEVLEETLPLDEWLPFEQCAYKRLQILVQSCSEHYKKHAFHHVLFELVEWFETDVSSVICEVLKDRLYCTEPSALPARSARQLLWTLLDTTTRLMAPIWAFTAEEVWSLLPRRESVESVHLTQIPQPNSTVDTHEESLRVWERLCTLRSVASKSLAQKGWERTSKDGAPIRIEVRFEDVEFWAPLSEFSEEMLAEVVGVAELHVLPATEHTTGQEVQTTARISLTVHALQEKKCLRCRRFPAEHQQLCTRCQSNVSTC